MGEKQNIFQLLDKYGATINATTSTDRTNFYSVIPSNVFDAWAGAESARMQHIPFDVSNRDKKEKMVVVDEVRMGNDNPFKRLTEHVMAAVFDRSGYGHMTSGYIDDVKQVKQSRLHKFWETFYGPNNCSMVVVGPVNVNKILRSVHKHFSDIERREVERVNRDEVPQVGPRQVFVYNDKPYTMTQIAFRAMEGMHKDSVVLDLIGEIMQYPKIGIMQVLKEMNAVPQYGIINNRTKRRNVFQITGSLATPNGITMFQSALWKWFGAIGQKDLDPHIFEMAKTKLRNKWNNTMHEGGVEAISGLATEAISMGHIADIWDRVAHLDTITMKDVNRVATYTFQESRCTVGVLCPKPHADILRPSMSHPDYPKNLFQEQLVPEPSSVGIENLMQTDIPSSNYKMDRFKCNFGMLQHMNIPSASKNAFVISTKAASKNEMLSKIATRIIVDGMKHAHMAHDTAHTFVFGKPSMDMTFNEFMIEKNLKFELSTNKGRMMFVITFDKGHDLNECLMAVASAVKNIPDLTQQNVALKASMVAGELAGSLHDLNFVAHKKITEAMFANNDINLVNDPNTLIQSVDSITMEQLKAFLNQLFDANNAFSATVISNESSDKVGHALQEFYDQFSNNASPAIPVVKHVSADKQIKSQTIRVVEPGKNDGVIGMGLRLKGLNRNSADFTALRVAADVLGDGIYSRLNEVLRVEKGETYGTYARLRGGLYNSDSYIHIFGSFQSNNLENAKHDMDAIVREFVSKGITEQEFNDKRSHLKNSLKVRMDSMQTLISLHHQTWLNNSNMTVAEIFNRIDALTHQDVNKCIQKYLNDTPIVTVLAGLPK